jgi:hypothetical protein
MAGSSVVGEASSRSSCWWRSSASWCGWRKGEPRRSAGSDERLLASYPVACGGSPSRVPRAPRRGDSRCDAVRGRGAETLQADAERQRRALHSPRRTAALEDRNGPRSPGARAPRGRLCACPRSARVPVAGWTERVRPPRAWERQDRSPGEISLHRSRASVLRPRTAHPHRRCARGLRGTADALRRSAWHSIRPSHDRADATSVAIVRAEYVREGAILLAPHFTGWTKWARRAHFC